MKTLPLFRLYFSLAALSALLSNGLKAGENDADPQELANLANQAMVEEDWEEASRLLDRALELAEDAPELWIGSGFARIRLEQIEEARERYEQALELYLERVEADPDNTGLVMNVGYTLVLLNRRDEAIDYLEDAAERNPNQPMFQNFAEIVDGLEANFSEFIVPEDDSDEQDPRED